MADLKISALTSATTPLAGTEVLPIVQSSTTKKVAISDVTAGRSVSVGDLTLTTGGAITTASEAYDYRYSSGGVGSNARVRYRTVYSGGGSGYGGSFELESRTSSNAWNTGAFSVTDAGNVSTTGNLIIATSGKGIDFSATSGSGTSELLADYEEGTWTPTQSTFTTWTSPVFTATYTKVGRLVTCTVQQTSGTVASVGVQNMGGLPYTAASYSSGVAVNGSAQDVSSLLIYSNNVAFCTATGAQTSLTFSFSYVV